MLLVIGCMPFQDPVGTLYQGKKILFCGGTDRGLGQCYSQSLKDFYEKKWNPERNVQDDHWELEQEIYMSENRIQPTAVMIDDDTWWVTGGHTGDEKGLDSTDILRYLFHFKRHASN